MHWRSRSYLAKIRAAGFEQVDVLSRDQAEVDEAAGWDDVQVIAAGEDGVKAKEILRGSGLAPHDVAHRVFSVKVRAVKPTRP